MPIGLRIDDIRAMPNGDREVSLTWGPTPLPAQPMRQTFTQSVDAWLAEATYFDDVPEEDRYRVLLRLGLLLWRRNNPAMNNPSVLIGKTLTLTITTTDITIAVTS